MTTSRSEILLKAFLQECSPEKQSRLESFLSESKRLDVQEAPRIGKAPSGALLPDSLLNHVHWSWLLPILKTYSEPEQVAFLSALSPSSAHRLSSSLQLVTPLAVLTEVAKSYFCELLERDLLLHKESLLPRDCLPPSPLNELLHLSKNQLIHLVNLLSLHDLALELRQIVETKILKKIYSFLTEEERKRLKEISSHKESFPLSRLPLDRWDGQEESLRLFLHRRGLARLSYALAHQDPDLIWYISHRLDIGRGSHLLTLCAKEASSEPSETLVREIEELLRNYL